MTVSVVIPALNEQEAIEQVVAAIPRQLPEPLRLAEIIVADNGSTDATAARAAAAGATVVPAPRRGYGAACLAGLEALKRRPADVVVFLDGDFSDDPADMPALLAPIAADDADLVIGSRVRHAATGALTPQQRFGNALACTLIRLYWGVHFTDLGPFRAVRREALEALAMDDQSYGWTAQMQVRAARLGLRCTEVEVQYRRRIGTSKISGTLRGVVLAGWMILYRIHVDGMLVRRKH